MPNNKANRNTIMIISVFTFPVYFNISISKLEVFFLVKFIGFGKIEVVLPAFNPSETDLKSCSCKSIN